MDLCVVLHFILLLKIQRKVNFYPVKNLSLKERSWNKSVDIKFSAHDAFLE